MAQETSRLAGADRVQTAVRVLESYGGWSDTAILVRKDAFADSLAATPLAGAQRSPILLTDSDHLDQRVVDVLRRHGFKNVVAVGGQSALGESVLSGLRAAGFNGERVAGASRYETALQLAQRTLEKLGGVQGPVFMATGTDFPDALSAGAAAVHNRGVLLLSKGGVLTPRVSEFIAARPGAKVVAVAAQLVEHYYGKPTNVVLASGEAFADAMTAGAVAGLTGQPLLPTQKSVVPAPIASYLEKHKSSLGRVTLVGGSNAISGTVEREVKTIVPQRWTPPQSDFIFNWDSGKSAGTTSGTGGGSKPSECGSGTSGVKPGGTTPSNTSQGVCSGPWGCFVQFYTQNTNGTYPADYVAAAGGYSLDLATAKDNTNFSFSMATYPDKDGSRPSVTGTMLIQLIDQNKKSQTVLKVTDIPKADDAGFVMVGGAYSKAKLTPGSYVLEASYEPDQNARKIGYESKPFTTPFLIYDSTKLVEAKIAVKNGQKVTLQPADSLKFDIDGFAPSLFGPAVNGKAAAEQVSDEQDWYGNLKNVLNSITQK